MGEHRTWAGHILPRALRMSLPTPPTTAQSKILLAESSAFANDSHILLCSWMSLPSVPRCGLHLILSAC